VVSWDQCCQPPGTGGLAKYIGHSVLYQRSWSGRKSLFGESSGTSGERGGESCEGAEEGVELEDRRVKKKEQMCMCM
jgi:hypothetical protein